MTTLYIVATPIGNLADISIRAIDVLKNVDLILCEDTRTTKKLLDRYEIKTHTLSYHQHSELKKIEYIIQLLSEGKNLALVSDAGTPGISDPGNRLIELVIGKLGDKVKTVPVPGPSAVTAAASVAGLPMDRFVFLGFPPAKRKRKHFFQGIVDSSSPVIFYESPHRILKSLNELRMLDKDLSVVVCRELTKKFETIYRGSVEKMIEQLKEEEIRGEFVIVVEKR